MSEYFTDERVHIRHPDRLFIGGAWVAPEGAALELISPSDETVHARVAIAGIGDVDRAVAAARQAFDKGPWPAMAPADRAAILRKAAERLRGRAAELAACWSFQTGVPTTVATNALKNPGQLYDYYADLISAENPAAIARDNGGYGIVVREPVGVVAAVVPWNHPSYLLSLKTAPALAMGCTIVAKPAPESPLDVFIFAECFEEAGLPPGVFNIVPAEREASDRLVRHPGVDKVSFTGSAATGTHISAICGARMARASMELGGKSAAIILDDIPIEKVIATLVPAAGTHLAGQGCALLTRVLVSGKRRDEVAEAYAAAMQAIRLGHAFDPQTQMGPIAMRRQRDKIEGYIAKGLAEGGRIITGGGRPAHLERGFFIEPTLFVDVTNDMTIAHEEIFGPVISIIEYETEPQAVEIANDSPYGLNGAVYTDDVEKAYAIARRIRAGNFTHNGLQHDSKFPFGGFKLSGMGREGGQYGLDLYSEIKTIYMAERPRAFS